MSAALLRKSLELVETPYVVNKKRSGGQTSQGSQNLLEGSVSIKHLGKSKGAKTQRGVADVRKKNINPIEKVKEKLRKKQERKKLRKRCLEKLKRPVLDERTKKIILERFFKGSAPEEEDTNKIEPTAFTEEDFKRFEQGYING